MKKRVTTGLLYQLAKQGKKEEFVNLVEQVGLIRFSQDLSPKDTALLIYSFNSIDLGKQDVWQRLEQLYMNKSHQMNIHDHVMCGWAFLKRCKNKEVWSLLISQIQSSWIQIKDIVILMHKIIIVKQSEKPNIGLIAYIMVLNQVTDQNLWQKMEWIFRETLQYQDERNYMLTIYSFARMGLSDDQTWKIFEMYFWNYPIKLLKNQVLVIYTFSKLLKGSAQLWQRFEELAITLDNIGAYNINCLAYAFGKMKTGNFQLWTHLINLMHQSWDEFSIHDFEISIWSLDNSIKHQKNMHNSQLLFDQITSREINFKKTNQNFQYSEMDDILNVARFLNNRDLLNTNLFQSLLKKFINLINSDNFFEQYTKRTWYLLPFFLSNKAIFDNSIQQKFLNKLNQNKSQTFMYDLNGLASFSQCDSKYFWEQMFIQFTSIEHPNIQYKVYIGLELLNHLPDNRELLKIMSDKTLIAQLYSNHKIITIQMIKFFSKFQQKKIFFENFFQFALEQKHIKKEYLGQLIKCIIYQSGRVIPQLNYLAFKHEIENLYFQLNNNQKKFEEIMNTIHSIILDGKSLSDLEKILQEQMNLIELTESNQTLQQEIQLQITIRQQFEKQKKLHADLIAYETTQLDFIEERIKNRLERSVL